jgi:uncharacterized protein YycO
MGRINLQFAESTSIGGRIIEWYDHGRFAHVDVVYPNGDLIGARDDVVAGIPSGVQVRPSTYLGDSKVFKVEIITSDNLAGKFYDFISAQIGKPYDESAIAGFVAGRNWYRTGEWFCSELVAAGLVSSGYLLPLSAPANKIAPDDLLLVLSGLTEVQLPPIGV